MYWYKKNGIGDVTVTSTTVTGTNINSLGDQRGYQYFGVTYTGDKGYPIHNYYEKYT